MDIKLLDLLRSAGFDDSLKTKMVRHKSRSTPHVERHPHFEMYQAYQKDPKFHNAEQIVTFYARSGNRAAFFGVYRVISIELPSDGPKPKKDEWPTHFHEKANHFYRLERDRKFDFLRDRLIVDWGDGTLAWVQKFRDKPVLEIEAPGRRLPRFSDYLEFSLTHTQLRELVKNPQAHRDWHQALREVAGVYLILAEKTGRQYIGSAYGIKGVWGRWKHYAKSGHGGNLKLKKLVEESGGRYPEHFRFSLLHILPKSMSKSEVIKRETKYKVKLGSRAIGLNAN